MKKAAVIGAGVSGLTVAHVLEDRYAVKVFEKEDRPGGLVRCERIDGSLFHLCGGHVFNSKNEKVLDWFWSKFDREREFVKATRNSSVCLEDGTFVAYPIENHVYQLGTDVQRRFVGDLLDRAACPSAEPSNFDEFLRGRFGKTLYDLYFAPYNAKVWRRDLTEIPLSWLAGKLPMPTVREMLEANIGRVEERNFVHSTFWYERSGGSQFVANRLAEGLDIVYGTDVGRIDALGDGRCRIGDEVFDLVVFCGNIKELPSVLKGIEWGTIADEVSQFEFHGTTAVFCELEANPYSWVYQPSRRHESHRIICTGNFSPTNNAAGRLTGTVEFTDEIGRDEILAQLGQMPFHPRYITHHFSRYTYPIQKKDTRDVVAALKRKLQPLGVRLVGRFAEWEYFNMDAAMASALACFNS